MTANQIRLIALDMIMSKGSGHIGSSFSIAEIVSYLYEHFDLINKDKLILSKGHAVPAIYAALNILGIIPDEELTTFREVNSRLQGHPCHKLIPELHATTGSLGQGLSIAIGHAIASKMEKSDRKIFCIVGDGEMQEGQIWEAIQLTPTLGLNNLVCIIDNNGYQNDGPIINERIYNPYIYDGFGWFAREIMNGNDSIVIEHGFQIHDSRPTMLILHTRKNAGMEFLGEKNWHGSLPTEEEYKQIKEKLSAKH